MGQKARAVIEESLAADTVTAATYLELGVLHVHLVGATGLKAADRNGKSDPFAKLSLAGQRAKSKTIMATLDPQWDELVASDP